MKNRVALATLCPRLFVKSIKTGSKIKAKNTKMFTFRTAS